MNSGFLDKFIERIGRVGTEDLQAYLLRLADEKGFLETIFNSIQEGVIVTDTQGHVNYLNRAACEFFGLQREDCQGRILGECLRGLDWEQLIEPQKVLTRDMEIFYPQHRFLNFYVVPLHLEKPVKRRKEIFEREMVGHAVIMRDITESRRSTEETIHSERLSALTMLAAGVAHELGNPLNSLHIHLQLLERKLRKVPEPARNELMGVVGVAREEIQRLDTIIQQFLGAIRPARLVTSLEDLNALLTECVEFLKPEIEDRNIIVELELSPTLPLLELDRTQIKQAFYNVIKNAFQAMKTGGILRITSDHDDRIVSVTFADTGGGISQENMSKIFEPYFTTKAGGSGLGLLIVRRIVREHGGEIELMSTEGQGLTLTLRLPMHDQRIRMLPGSSAEEEPKELKENRA